MPRPRRRLGRWRIAKDAVGDVLTFTDPVVSTKKVRGTATITTTTLSFGTTLTAADLLIARTTATTRITVVPGYTCVIRIATARASEIAEIRWSTSLRTAIVHYAP